MSALVIDTSSWVSYFDGRGANLIDEALAESRVYVPPVVVAELLSGRMTDKDRVALEDMLGDLPVCGTSDITHWFRVGKLRSRLRSKGLSVSTPDAHVAQCSMDLTGELLTEDRIFWQIARHQPLRLAEG